MSLKSTSELLAMLTPAARELLAARLRAEGALAEGAPLDTAFPEAARDIMDCVVGCQDSYAAAIEACTTDECRAGAAFAYRACVRKCKQDHGL